LTAAVSNEGGLGSFGAHHLSPQEILTVAHEIRQRTSRPFALNLWVSDCDGEEGPLLAPEDFERALTWLGPYCEELGLPLPSYQEQVGQRFEEQIEAVVEAQPAVFSFVFGVPSAPIMKRLKQRNIVTMGAATSVEEARALAAAGVEIIVASGLEAGGHRPSFLQSPEDSLHGTLALVPRVVDAVQLPVVAAGGIADGRGWLASLVLGASAAQIGTAFLACEESAASPIHREKLFSHEAASTHLTRAFSGRLARGIRNRFVDEMKSRALAPYPAQSWLSGRLKAAAAAQGRWDLMALWAGQAAPLLRHRRAAELCQSLVREVEQQRAHLTGETNLRC
jgi:nitronate monooxygenase